MAFRLCPHCMQMSDSDLCPHCGKDVNYDGSPAHLPVGYVVRGKHPYVLGAALGQGGFGITYIALDMVTNERVAIKEYFPTYCSGRTGHNTVSAYQNQEEIYQKGKERFLDEARTLKSLSDLPNIVDVLDFFELNNTAYLVMEFLEGSSLKDYAAKNGAFPAQAFLKQIRPLMEDIQKMHDRGVIHRDIAPDNIILQPDGRMKLIDFGAARSYIGDKSMTVVVKKGFAPVEQYFSTGSTPATDIYALAATIYYCITGKVPMDSAQRQAEETPLTSPSALGADITPEQETALMNALEIQQKARTQSVQKLLDDLHKKPSSSTSRKQQPKTETRKSDPPRKKQLPLILSAVASLLLLAGGFLLPHKKSETSIQATEPAKPTIAPTATTATKSPADRINEPVVLNLLAAQYSSETARWWQEFEDDFEEQYPLVDLQADVTSWNDVYTIVNTRIANDEAPDILNIDVFTDYQADGLLLPVHKYLSDETYAKFYPQFLEQSTLNGKVWAVPDLASTRALYYNAQIFGELGLDAPTTWEELEEACRAIKKAYPNKYPLGLDLTQDEGHITFSCFALSAGGGFTDSRGVWKLNCNENAETISFLTSLVKSGLTNRDPSSENRYDLQDLFAEGKVTMMVAPDSASYVFEAAGVSYGVVPIPAMSGKQSSTISVMDRFMCFDNGQSAAELAAITCFYDFLYEDQRYVDWISTEGFLPATSTGAQLLASEDPSLAVWHDALASSTFFPVEKNGWPDAKTGIISVMQEVLLGGDPKNLLNSLQQALVH